MNLAKLKQFSMAEAIYISSFLVKSEDLEDKPREEVITDYEHLEENVAEVLGILPERERTILQLILEDKLTLKMAGAAMNFSSTRASQIFNHALRALRHPKYRRILDGTSRQQRLETEADQQRKADIAKTWAAVGEMIEWQICQQSTRIAKQLTFDIDYLSLTPVCTQKLRALEVNTVGELLAKFPYDPQTNGLRGLATADGIEEIDYQEIWCALYNAVLLIRLPELPDFEAIRKAEWAALISDDASKVLDVSIDTLDLSIRSHNCLRHNNIWSIDDLLSRVGLSVDEILEKDKQDVIDLIGYTTIRNMGRKSAEEITNRLYDLLNGDDI